MISDTTVDEKTRSMGGPIKIGDVVAKGQTADDRTGIITHVECN